MNSPIHRMIILLLLFPALTGSGHAQTPATQPGKQAVRVIPLKECLTLAVSNSATLRISALEQTRLRYGYRETVGAALPHINLAGSWDDYLNLPTSLIPGEFFGRPGEMIPVQFGTTYNLSGALDASQMLYNQAWLVGLRMARQALRQNELATEKAESEVVYEVAQSYYLAQITRQQIRNLQVNLDQIARVERIAGSQWEQGLIKKVDLDRIAVQKLNMETERERLETLYRQIISMQKYYMGLGQETEIEPEDSIRAGVMEVKPGGSGDHIDLRLLQQQKELVASGIRLEQAGYYPSLTLIGATNFINQSNTMYLFGKPTDWFNTTLVGLRLQVPLFGGMQRHYRVSQSRVELEKLTIRENDARTLLRIASDDANRKLLNSLRAEKRQRENMALAGRVYSISQEQYQKGVIPLSDLLTAEAALSEAQSNHTYALIQMKVAELDLLRANGKLSEILL